MLGYIKKNQGERVWQESVYLVIVRALDVNTKFLWMQRIESEIASPSHGFQHRHKS